MKTDYLDLVQFHASPSKAQLEEHGGLEALQDLQRQGKVRFIGISGTLPNLTGADRDGRLRRLPDPLLGPAARARGR